MPTHPTNPHDHFFKAVFNRPDVASDFLCHYLPEEVSTLLDLNTLAIHKDTFVDQDLAEHYSDLLYQVDLQDSQAGYVYVLFEHKSYSEPLIGLDLLRYLVRIWEQVHKAGSEKTLPVIVPMVIYHGRRPWRIGAEFISLVAAPAGLTPYVPNFRYVLVDLSIYLEEEIRGEVMLRTALLVLKYIFRDELRERLPAIFGLLQDLVQQRTGLEYLETLLRYVVRGARRGEPEAS